MIRKKTPHTILIFALLYSVVTPVGSPREEAERRLELHVMALCPYAAEAILQVLQARQRSGGAFNLELYYIVRENESSMVPSGTSSDRILSASRSVDQGIPEAEGRFHSLHGPPEIEEAKRQIILREFFPDLWEPYLVRRYTEFPETDSGKILNDLGAPAELFQDLLRDPAADDLLHDNIEQVRERNVRASPTLYVNGRLFTGPITVNRILRLFCRGEESGSLYCADVPVCGGDEDCRMEGMIGVCADPETSRAECRYFPIEEVPVTWVPGPDDRIFDASPVFEFLRQYLSGLRPVRVSGEEKTLPFLPYYRFEREIEKAPRFSSLKSFLLDRKDHYVLDPEWLSVVSFPRREAIPGRVELVSPFDSWEGALVREWFRASLPAVHLRVRLTGKPEGTGDNTLILEPGEGGMMNLVPATSPAGHDQGPNPAEEIGLDPGRYALLVDNRIWIRDFDSEIREWLKEHFAKNQPSTTPNTDTIRKTPVPK